MSRSLRKKPTDLFPALRTALKKVDFDVTDEHTIASSMTMLFNMMSREAKQKLTDVDLGSEQDVKLTHSNLGTFARRKYS